MLESIRESFVAQGLNAPDIQLALIGIGLAVCVLLLLILIRLITNRKNSYFPVGSITDPKHIHSILCLAFDQRRPFELQVKNSSSAKRPTLRCAPAQLGKSTFSLELNGVTELSDSWLNREVTVFFRISVDGNYTYYMFDSSIQAISYPKKDLCHLTLNIPALLDNKQKRAFLRMPPPSDLVLGSALWLGPTMPLPENIYDLTQWPAPSFLLLPKKCEEFRIIDMSAGGMRITIPKDKLTEHEIDITTIDQLIVLIDLYAPDQNKRLRFWIQCRIQNLWNREDLKEFHLGLQFLAWARARETGNQEAKTQLEWLRLSSSYEVEGIGNWIMRRHLELFRDLPEREE